MNDRDYENAAVLDDGGVVLAMRALAIVIILLWVIWGASSV